MPNILSVWLNVPNRVADKVYSWLIAAYFALNTYQRALDTYINLPAGFPACYCYGHENHPCQTGFVKGLNGYG